MVRNQSHAPVSVVSCNPSRKGKGADGRLADRVQISDASGLRARAKLLIAEMPDVRLDMIENIRASIEQGTYQMNSWAISAYIVRNALSERAWG